MITEHVLRCNFFDVQTKAFRLFYDTHLHSDDFFSVKASSQNFQIQGLPQPVIYQENDLVIQCSITNPPQLSNVYYMQLYKNVSTDFETVVSIFVDSTPQIHWSWGSLS